MLLFKIAWRNIWRNPLRSGVIMLSLMVGLWAGVFIMAFMRGMINEQIHTAVSRQFSHIQVHMPAYKEDEHVHNILPPDGKIQADAAKVSGYQAASGRIQVTAMAATPYGSSGVMLYGIDPLHETAVTGLKNYLVQGQYLDSAKRGSMLIGRKLQEKLKVQVGQKIVLTFQNASDELNAAAFRVAGVYGSNNSSYEETILYVPAVELAPLLGLENNDVHEVAILLSDNRFLEIAAAEMRRSNPSVLVETWKQLSPELRLVIDSFNQYMYIIIGVILLALIFGIINAMLMAVLERQRELGVLMAVGMNKVKVFVMILMETVQMTIGGCALGLPAAWISVWWFGQHGIDLSNWSEGLAMYGYGNVVYPSLEGIYYVEIAMMAMVASLLASIYPARRSLKLKPADAIRKI